MARVRRHSFRGQTLQEYSLCLSEIELPHLLSWSCPRPRLLYLIQETLFVDKAQLSSQLLFLSSVFLCSTHVHILQGLSLHRKLVTKNINGVCHAELKRFSSLTYVFVFLFSSLYGLASLSPLVSRILFYHEEIEG